MQIVKHNVLFQANHNVIVLSTTTPTARRKNEMTRMYEERELR